MSENAILGNIVDRIQRVLERIQKRLCPRQGKKANGLERITMKEALLQYIAVSVLRSTPAGHTVYEKDRRIGCLNPLLLQWNRS